MLPKCVRALRRIFFLSDLDCDGFLNEQELNQFQETIFGQSLHPDELSSIIDCISTGCPEGLAIGKGVTEEGFLFLNQLFIQRGRLETTWAVLKYFGFDDSLDFTVDFSLLKQDKAKGIVPQLSKDATIFIMKLFDRLDKDQDAALNEKELAFLFDLLPANPWETFSFPENVELDTRGNVTLPAFLAQWNAFVISDPEQCHYSLRYLGFTLNSPFDYIKAGKLEQFEKRYKRNVFKCLVIGDESSGKTALLRSIIKRPFSDSYLPTDYDYNVIAAGLYKAESKYIQVPEHYTLLNSLISLFVVCRIWS
jgi:Ras family protein T1